MSVTSRAGEIEERIVADTQAGLRLDTFLAEQFPDYSRVQLRKAISGELVTINGKSSPIKVAYRLRPGDLVRLTFPAAPKAGPQPEELPLDLLYEDDWLAVVNKPAGMVVHPARGHWSGTLTSALAFHFDKLSGAGGPSRPGIVHRLDRDTSGAIIIAKTDQAHFALAEQFEQRDIAKHYFAICVGVPDWDRDQIDQPIGIHPYQREKMAIRRDHATSRPAQTIYEVAERFDGFSVLNVFPKTGRTHQIRVHLASIHCPVLCDKLYGGRSQITRGELRRKYDSAAPEDHEVILQRQALHAKKIAFRHPQDGRAMEFEAPLPADLELTLAELRKWRGKG